MPIPFGFSVGDFVTVLNLFKEIGLALRDHGGASDDYQKTIEELETINEILQQLQCLPSATADLSQINAIKAQAQLSQHAVSRVLDNAAKYNSSLGHGSAKGLYRGMISKAKWATIVSKEVKRLKEVINAQCLSIKLLMDIHTT